MTVTDLIEMLHRYDPDTPVLRGNYDVHRGQYELTDMGDTLTTLFVKEVTPAIGPPIWLDVTDTERDQDLEAIIL